MKNKSTFSSANCERQKCVFISFEIKDNYFTQLMENLFSLSKLVYKIKNNPNFEKFINPPDCAPYLTLFGICDNFPYRLILHSEIFSNKHIAHLSVFSLEKEVNK